MIKSIENLNWLKGLYQRVLNSNPIIDEKYLTENEKMAFDSVENALEVLNILLEFIDIKVLLENINNPEKSKKIQKFYNNYIKK